MGLLIDVVGLRIDVVGVVDKIFWFSVVVIVGSFEVDEFVIEVGDILVLVELFSCGRLCWIFFDVDVYVNNDFFVILLVLFESVFIVWCWGVIFFFFDVFWMVLLMDFFLIILFIFELDDLLD